MVEGEGPMPSQRESHVTYRAVLLAGGLVVLGFLFRELLFLLVALLITIIIAIPLTAATNRLQRLRVPRGLGALLGLLAGLAVMAGLLVLIIPAFVDQTNRFVNDVPTIVNSLEDRIGDITGASHGEIGNKVQTFFRGYTDDPARLIGSIASIGLGVAGAVGSFILILVVAYFIAVQPQPLIDGLLALFPPSRRPQATRTLERLRAAWVGWMVGTGVKMVIVGVLLWVGLQLAGLDFALVFAVLTALLVVIPYIGGLIGMVPPVLLALTDSTGKTLVVFLIYLGVLQLEGNVIIPVVMSRTVKLHPALIAAGVVVVGNLLGLLGLFVAIPVLSLIVILADELWVKPIAEADARRTAAMGLPPGAELVERPGVATITPRD